MQEGDIAAALRDTFIVILKLSGPPLLGVLAVGLVVSLFQAVTQINEQTLAFVPKLLGLIGILALFGHYLFASLSAYTHLLYDQLIVVGGT
jgi:flagellar biosynthetic protein FliQ